LRPPTGDVPIRSSVDIARALSIARLDAAVR
jgi:hypothetical protein